MIHKLSFGIVLQIKVHIHWRPLSQVQLIAHKNTQIRSQFNTFSVSIEKTKRLVLNICIRLQIRKGMQWLKKNFKC